MKSTRLRKSKLPIAKLLGHLIQLGDATAQILERIAERGEEKDPFLELRAVRCGDRPLRKRALKARVMKIHKGGRSGYPAALGSRKPLQDALQILIGH